MGGGECEPANPIRQVGTAAHDGCVLGLSITGGAIGAPPVVYTASGRGGACCFAIDFANDGGVMLRRQWRAGAPPAATAPTDW